MADTTLQIGFNFDEASAKRAIKALEQLTTVMSGIQNTVDATTSSVSKLNQALDKLGNSQGASSMRGAGLLPPPSSSGMRYGGNNFGSGPKRIGYDGGSSRQTNSGGGGGFGGGGGSSFNTTAGGFSPQDFVKAKEQQQKKLAEESDSIKRLSSFNLALQSLTAVVAGAAAIFGLGKKVIDAGNETAGQVISANMKARATNMSLDQILGLQFGLKAAGADSGAAGSLAQMTRDLLLEDTGAGAVSGENYGKIVAGLSKSSAAGIPEAISAIEDAVLSGDQGKIMETLLQSLVIAGNDPTVNAGAIAKTMGMESLAGLDDNQFKTIMEYFTRGYGSDVGNSQALRGAMTETDVIVFKALQANVDTMAAIVTKVNELLYLLEPALGTFLDGILLALDVFTNPKEGIKNLLSWSVDNSLLNKRLDSINSDDRSMEDMVKENLFQSTTGFSAGTYSGMSEEAQTIFDGLINENGNLDRGLMKEYLISTGGHKIGGGLYKQFEARANEQGLELFIQSIDLISDDILGDG